MLARHRGTVITPIGEAPEPEPGAGGDPVCAPVVPSASLSAAACSVGEAVSLRT
ncbi:hypothetical protein [Sphaerimonospora mesophila]|uniref:hypothetical protein n=1 Tax=Sphaerimonospora mesophila TaxID=37483 RepID=UPI000B0294C7